MAAALALRKKVERRTTVADRFSDSVDSATIKETSHSGKKPKPNTKHEQTTQTTDKKNPTYSGDRRHATIKKMDEMQGAPTDGVRVVSQGILPVASFLLEEFHYFR